MPKRTLRQRRNRPRRKTPDFSKRVLAVINRQRELKVSRPLSLTGEPVSPDISAGDLVKIMPDIAVGDAEFNRTGNEITLKKIVINAYYAQTFPVGSNNDSRAMVRSMITRQRNCESAGELLGGNALFLENTILENAQPYSSGITSYLTPINHTAFVVRKQFKKIMTAPVAQIVGGVPTSQSGGSTDSSYFMIQYTMTFGKGKKIYYRNTGTNAPANFPYFLMHSASALNSAVSPTLGSVLYNQTATAYFFDS